MSESQQRVSNIFLNPLIDTIDERNMDHNPRAGLLARVLIRDLRDQ